MKKFKIIGSSLVVIGMLSLVLLAWCNKELTAGDYTNEIIALKQSNSDLTKQIEANNANIKSVKEKMCALPNAEANWTCEGFTTQTQSAQRTWTQAPELTWKVIQM